MTWSNSNSVVHSKKFYTAFKGSVRTLYGKILRKRVLAELAKKSALIVAFHRVNDDQEDTLTCSIDKFREFCLFFKDNFDVVSVEALIGALEQNQPIGGKLAITFDDGYRDNYLRAAPILQELELPASFFVTTNFISNTTVAWWDEHTNPVPEWMSWEEVNRLKASGFAIGAHTMNHADLGKLSRDEILGEVEGSKLALEKNLGVEPELFAYPYGGVNNITTEARELVESTGFRCCLSCHGGAVGSSDNPFSMQRIAITDWYDNPYQLVVDLLGELKKAP